MSTDRTGMILAGAPADRLPIWMLPHLYRYYAAGERANHCVDAALTLAAAFAQFGIPARPWPVELEIEPADGDQAVRYGTDPRWHGDDFRGHCVLWLPEHHHVIDVTLEQFAETSGEDPLVGRAAYAVDPTTGRRTAISWAEGGGTLAVQRPECLLQYTAGTTQQAEAMLAAPLVRANSSRHHRAGTNLASQTLRTFALSPDVLARARSGPFPRVRQLLDAVAELPVDVDDAGDYRFAWPGPNGSRQLRLDEIPL